MHDIPINKHEAYNKILAAEGQRYFDFTFPLFDRNHILVRMQKAGSDTKTFLTLGWDYSITTALKQENGGTVGLATPAGAGDIITLILNPPEERVTDFPPDGELLSWTLNDELDYETQVDQALRRDVKRSLKADYGEDGEKIYEELVEEITEIGGLARSAVQQVYYNGVKQRKTGTDVFIVGGTGGGGGGGGIGMVLLDGEFVPLAIDEETGLIYVDIPAAKKIHKHDAGDITSGILPPERGGTGNASGGGPASLFQNVAESVNGAIVLQNGKTVYPVNAWNGNATISIDASGITIPDNTWVTFEMPVLYGFSRTITWPNNLVWLNGEAAPVLDEAGTYLFAVRSTNGGGLWVANLQGTI